MNEQTHEEIKLPPQIAINSEVATNERFLKYEEELLRLLIMFGNDILFIIAKDDEPSVDITVAGYIFKELADGEVQIRIPICKRIYDMYFEAYNNGQKPDATMFTLNADAEISKFAVDLLVPVDKLSKIWDKRNRYIPPEELHLKDVIDLYTTSREFCEPRWELHLKDVIDRSINGYKSEIVQQILNSMNKKIEELQKEPDKDEEIMNLMKEYSDYLKYKNALASYLGRIVIRN